MEHIKSIEKREGCSAYGANIHPIDREGCVGKAGIDKSYTLDMVMKLAYKMDDKPNIIIKGGKNAKWYMKKIPLNKIDDAIEKQKWKDNMHYCTMYIIVWD